MIIIDVSELDDDIVDKQIQQMVNLDSSDRCPVISNDAPPRLIDAHASMFTVVDPHLIDDDDDDDKESNSYLQ